ncbi:cytochrome P450 [Streptomyces sp. NPDC054863]
MTVAEQETGRRLQLVQGIHWLYAAGGDPYAALLRGVPGTPPSQEYARIAAGGPVWRSRLGTWVSGQYASAAELLALAAAHPAPPPAPQPRTALAWDAGLPAADAADVPAADRVRELTALACARRFAGLRDGSELVAEVAARVPAEVLADLHGLTGGDRERSLSACADAAPALDAALAPPSYDEGRRILEGVAVLRGLLGGSSARRAVVEVRAARELVAGTLHALLREPGQWAELAAGGPPAAERAVAETLRHDPPVKVCAFTAPADAEVGGARIGAGDQVAVVLGAAHRDPAVYADPDRFDPWRSGPSGADGQLLVPAPHGVTPGPLVRATAVAVVAELAARWPALRAAGPAHRRGRAPVTGGLAHLPVVLGRPAER